MRSNLEAVNWRSSYVTPRCYPERSEAESKDPVVRPYGNATGFLDFARNDGP
ncbi:MAG: hypothetical protein Udaeo2_00390 [Candidatus Udaeobacter sp.]|nr:MAG: hypothetical protein Udaeo2_00390 [Candidatus Udaeobacter sp.]